MTGEIIYSIGTVCPRKRELMRTPAGAGAGKSFSALPVSDNSSVQGRTVRSDPSLHLKIMAPLWGDALVFFFSV